MITWLDLIGAAATTGSLGLCTGVLLGTRNRDLHETLDRQRTSIQRYEQQLATALADNLELRRHHWEYEANMICDPCKEAADMDARLGVPVSHDPTICRDHALGVHGCPCEHGSHLAERAGP